MHLDRLPTVSASQALQGLGNDSSSYLASGIPSLDSALLGAGNVGSGGIERGKVTELWGPIGAGKTAIAYVTSPALHRPMGGIQKTYGS